ncbi:MAG: glycosyltransferase [Planctomycetota bacterium]
MVDAHPQTAQPTAGTPGDPGTPEHPLRCMLQQAAMPKFRVPFYRDLASRPGIDLKVMYGSMAIPNVESEGFERQHRVVKQLPGGLFWDSAHMRALASERLDAISMSWNTRYLSLFPGIRRAQKRGTGVVVWGHGYSKNEGTLRKKLRMRAAQLADAVVLYTPDVAERLVEEGLPREKVFVALNSLDQEPIQAARDATLADRSALRAWQREQGLDQGPVLLFVSRLYEPNKVDWLITAGKRLRDKHPGLQVVITGKGPDEERLRAHAEAEQAGDMVRFTGPIYEEHEIAKYFCTARAFCYPANIGLSILHAMGYGVPVITSDKIESQNPEIIALEHGKNGLLYTHGSVNALTEALDRVISDDELHASMSAHAHRTATERFSIERMADGMEAALRYAAARARARSAGR